MTAISSAADTVSTPYDAKDSFPLTKKQDKEVKKTINTLLGDTLTIIDDRKNHPGRLKKDFAKLAEDTKTQLRVLESDMPKGHAFAITAAALDICAALIYYSGFINNGQAIDAETVAQNSAEENNINQQGSDEVDAYWQQYIAPILAEGSSMSDKDGQLLGGYNTTLGVLQSEFQVPTKSLDPIVSRTQDLITQIVQNLNTVIDEAGTIVKGFQATMSAIAALK